MDMVMEFNICSFIDSIKMPDFANGLIDIKPVQHLKTVFVGRVLAGLDGQFPRDSDEVGRFLFLSLFLFVMFVLFRCSK